LCAYCIRYSVQKVIATINLAGLCHNARYFRRLTGVPLYAVIKADGYGHGSVETAQALTGIADGFAVALLEEGLTVRAHCDSEVLVFTPPTTEQEGYLMLVNGLTPTVGGMRTARLLDELCKRTGMRARVHIKCNTGMNRYGADLPTLGKICRFFKESGRVEAVGLYSHLYLHDPLSAEVQRQRFLSAQRICRGYFPRVKCHLSATYGALLGKAFAFDGVRIGLGLYGYLPDDVKADAPLKKVMQVYAKCMDERTYSYGGAGYTDIAIEKGGKMRTLRYGYADGKAYKGGGLVYGTPCMDACVCAGDKRRLYGRWTPVVTDAREIAKREGTISYEVLCRASARAERIYGYD